MTPNSASFYLNAPVHADIWAIKLDATADIAFLPPPPNVRMTIPSVTGVVVDVPAESIPSNAQPETLVLTPTSSIATDVTLRVVTRSQ